MVSVHVAVLHTRLLISASLSSKVGTIADPSKGSLNAGVSPLWYSKETLMRGGRSCRSAACPLQWKMCCVQTKTSPAFAGSARTSCNSSALSPGNGHVLLMPYCGSRSAGSTYMHPFNGWASVIGIQTVKDLGFLLGNRLPTSLSLCGFQPLHLAPRATPKTPATARSPCAKGHASNG